MILGRFRFDVWIADLPVAPVADPSILVLAADAGHDLERFGTNQAELVKRSAEGDIALGAIVDGSIVGVHWLCSTQHRDRYLGWASKPDDNFAYGHKLLVVPEGRGRGLATSLLVAARHVAATTWGLGLRQAVDPENEASVGAHQRAGFRPSVSMRGIRIGEQTLRREHRHAATALPSTLHSR